MGESRRRRPPEVGAGDVALVIREPPPLTEPLVIPWAEVDRVEHLREVDPFGFVVVPDPEAVIARHAARPAP